MLLLRFSSSTKDLAFMDGKTPWKLKKDYKMHFVVLVRTTMNIAEDARPFRNMSTSYGKIPV